VDVVIPDIGRRISGEGAALFPAAGGIVNEVRAKEPNKLTCFKVWLVTILLYSKPACYLMQIRLVFG
jgi:hypothetical protein